MGSADLNGGALAAAVLWVQALLIGQLALTVAIIAVAVFGLLMLRGHIDKERGIRILLGCALVFGAPGIAAALLAGAASTTPAPPNQTTQPQVAKPEPEKAPPFDPYAGASVPVR